MLDPSLANKNTVRALCEVTIACRRLASCWLQVQLWSALQDHTRNA